MSTIDLSDLCKESFERFPFGVIFSKSAPKNLDEVNVETDFCYYYFSPGLERRCLLRRVNMLTGYTNAKRDFPADYVQYFKDDIEVVKKYSDSTMVAAKIFCEPWTPPGVVGSIHFVYNLKTAFLTEESAYMLGVFEIIDDFMIGDITELFVSHDAKGHLPALYPTENCQSVNAVPNEWFQSAFTRLPIGVAIFVANSDQIVIANHSWFAHKSDLDSNISSLKSKVGEGLDIITQAYMIYLTEYSVYLGVYGIFIKSPSDISEELYHVYIIRPAMRAYANPYYESGKLIDRSMLLTHGQEVENSLDGL
eukprot:gene13641-18305_t